MSIKKCILIDLPRIQDHRGNLTFVQFPDQLPFAIKRVYYLYDVPGGADRGGHAHVNLRQMMVALSGSFDVVLDDGVVQKVFHLNRAFTGLLIEPGIWRHLNNFSSGAICLNLASEIYSEDDYIRDYNEFKSFKTKYNDQR